MEGGGGYGYGYKYGVFDRKAHHLIHQTPPLTAVERFLWSSNGFKQQEIQSGVNKRDGTNGLCDFSSFRGSSSGFSLPTLQDFSCVDGWLTDGEAVDEMNDDMGFTGEIKLCERKGGDMGKRLKGGSSATSLIKGQWTDEEDRLLIKLVKEHGVRKWAQIAQKMIGRAGKQCRERWHNHLRPDIKKDTWSEEEERMLVEAHEKIGNKWAEIAKRIPGRSENAIKNHWNATKRRQNSRRKNRKAACHSGGKVQPSILQDYIRKKGFANDTSSTLVPTTPATITSSTIVSTSSTNPLINFGHSDPSDYSFTDDSSTLMADTYEDESLFMENFFENILKDPVDGTVVQSNDMETYHHDGYIHNVVAMDYTNSNQFNDYSQNSSVLATTNSNIQRNNTQDKNINTSTFTSTSTSHLPSDLYLSYLLDGVNSFSPTNKHQEPSNFDEMQASYYGKKDMDLIEMVFSRGSNTSNM